MVLVTIPAIDGLKAWARGGPNLGATSFRYWRRVGIPVLCPAFLGGMRAAVRQLLQRLRHRVRAHDRHTNLASIQIRFFLQGNTITDWPAGLCVPAWMIIIMIVAIDGISGCAVVPQVAAMSAIHPPVVAPAQPGPTSERPEPRHWLVVAHVRRLLPVPDLGRAEVHGLTLPSRAGRSRHTSTRSRARRSQHVLAQCADRVLDDHALPCADAVDRALDDAPRCRRVQPVVEFISILPYMVPPIAFVVGIAGCSARRSLASSPTRGASFPFYTVLAMPFTYRALDAGIRAIDVKTLTEASRGAGCRLARHDLASGHPQHSSGVARCHVPHRGGGAGRVHDRVAPAHHDVLGPSGRRQSAGDLRRSGARPALHARGGADVRRARHLHSQAWWHQCRQPPSSEAFGGRSCRRWNSTRCARRSGPPSRSSNSTSHSVRASSSASSGRAAAARPRPCASWPASTNPTPVRVLSPARTSPGPAEQARHGHGVPGLQPVPQPHRGRERRVRSAAAPASAEQRRKRVAEMLELVGRSTRRPTDTRSSSPVVSSNGSRSPGRSPSSPRCCCSTNPSRHSTRRCG